MRLAGPGLRMAERTLPKAMTPYATGRGGIGLGGSTSISTFGLRSREKSIFCATSL